MDLTENILSLLIWLPIAGGAGVLFIGDAGDSSTRRARQMRWMALGVSVLTFIVSIPLYTQFDTTTAAMQFVERSP